MSFGISQSYISRLEKKIINKMKNVLHSIKNLNLEIIIINIFKGGFSFVKQQSRNMWSKYIKVTIIK